MKSKVFNRSVTKVSKTAKHISSGAPAPAQKGKMGHPAGKSGNKMGPQMSAKSTVKTGSKVANRRTLFDRVKNIPMFKD